VSTPDQETIYQTPPQSPLPRSSPDNRAMGDDLFHDYIQVQNKPLCHYCHTQGTYSPRSARIGQGLWWRLFQWLEMLPYPSEEIPNPNGIVF
jgi:hypothetical protein